MNPTNHTGPLPPGIERTLAIIKPDAWPQRGGEIITMATSAGLVPIMMRVTQVYQYADPDGYKTWAQFYVEHDGKPFFNALTEFMSSGPVLLLVLEGADAIKKWRARMGATDSRKASAETIRGKFGARMQMPPAPCPGAKDGRHCFASGVRYLVEGWFCIACNRGLEVIHESDIARDTAYPMWRNAVHGSDSPEAAAREIAFFFGAD